ncbi:hypothetical protein ACLSYX_05355 [[Pasteurella] aerogenes]
MQHTDKQMIVLAVVLFSIISELSMFHPENLDNGKAANQLALGELLTWQECV